MAKKNDAWGIEVGANALKAIRLVKQGGQLTVVDYAVLPFKKILTTPDLNVDEAIQVQLDAFLAKHDINKSNVVVSVPGNMAFARFAKLPPVEPKKIPDIVRFEAVQQIPFPIEQVEWDYQVFQQEDSPDVEVGIFAITKERVMTFLTNYRRVNISVDALTLSPLAVYNAFSYDNADDDDPAGTIYMDIGTTSTDVIIVESGGIWLRTLPIGGNQFTEALVKAFKLSFPKAEKLKREASTSKYARQIFQAMRPIFADLVQEVQRSLGYYQSLNRDADLTRLVGVGSTFRLPGLTKFLKQQLQLDVVRPDGFKRIHVDGRQAADFAENAMNLATAYGCALQGLGLETVSANVLPAAILKQRLWRSKQPWIAAAAAAVAIASGLAVGRYYLENANYAASAAEHDRPVQGVISRANGFSSSYNELQNTQDPHPQIKNLRRLLDYRDLWPKIVEDITLAAATTQPPAPSLTADYAKLDPTAVERERDRWRRLYIDQIEAEYQPMGGDQTAGDATGRTGRTGSADLGPDLATRYNAEQFWAGQSAPRYVVTVTGTTPYADAATLLDQTFIQWLKKNAERQDRPYKIIVDQSVIASLRQLGEEGLPGEARTNRNTNRRPRPVAEPRFNNRRNGSNQRFGDVMREMEMPRGATPDLAQAEETPLYPARPFVDLDRSRDWRFELTWVVELKKPDEARRSETLSAPPPAPPPAAQASPTDGTHVSSQEVRS